jgi:hypothetical protein
MIACLIDISCSVAGSLVSDADTLAPEAHFGLVHAGQRHQGRADRLSAAIAHHGGDSEIELGNGTARVVRLHVRLHHSNCLYTSA